MAESVPASPDIQLFRDVFDASPIGIAVENLDGQPLFVNPAFCSFLGFNEEELRRKHCVDFSPREDAEKDWALFQKLKQGLINHYQLDKRYFRRDGSLVWGRLNLSLLKSRSAPLVIAMVEDITEQKRSEEALRDSEERLRLAQQAARIGTFEWNIQTGVNTWTPELETIYGLPPGGFGGTQASFENLLHPDDREEVTELARGSLKTGQPSHGEWRVVWPDGSVHWIAGRWQVFMNESGQRSRVVGVNMDVTERKQAENALRASEERFRLAARAGRMYSFDWDVTTDMVLRSSEHVDIFGLMEPLRSTHTQFVEKIYPDDRPAFIATVAELTPQKPSAEITYRMQNSDGGLVWLKSSGRAFFDVEGKLLRVIGMVADITDLKHAEEAVSAMTRKLIEAQEQERSRIGRELHDDINQRIAMLAVELEQRLDPSEFQNRVQGFREELRQISDDVQALSHDLHSTKLEYLGFVAGMKSWCKEFSERQKFEIDFRSDVRSVLPLDLGSPLFRVLQEAYTTLSSTAG